MIYTCTTNPSLDYYISYSEDIKKGESNRSDMEMYSAGGKGVNVSIILNNFRIPTKALGFLGGFTKDFYLELLKEYSFIQPLFTSIKDNSRINVKAIDSDITSLQAKGPQISSDEFAKFKNRSNSIFSDDIFVLSGNVQENIEDGIIEMVKELGQEGTKIVLDTNKRIVDETLCIKPFLVQIGGLYNNYNQEEIIKYAKELIEKGAINVLYSNPHEDSLLINKDGVYSCANLEDNLVNTTGSNDSMIGGFLYSTIRGATAVESFKYACAASIATTTANDQGSKEIIEQRFNTIVINEVK